ncbi:MAG: zinc ribbon domain-containing protein, partial [Ruminiclostridium sp.]
RAAAAVLLLIVLMLACSCMDMETGIIFKEDGSARVYCDMTVDEELLEKAGKTKEEFLQSISESSDSDKFESWDNREEITKTVSGKTYFGIRYFADKTWDEITSIDNVNNSEIFCEIKNEDGKISVKMVLNGIGETSGGDVAEYIAQGMMNVRFRITAPFELVETNGTKDEDGSVYWDLIPVCTGSVSSLEMTATYKAGGINLLLILCIAGGVVVVAGIIIAVVLLTKKKPAAPAPVPMGVILGEQPAPAQQPAPAEQPAPVPAKFCKDCGAKIEDGSKFCINCGAKQD